ncbi:hypothetical protein BDP81DRAFT_83143 [Colletotrichum phormii]|uniref:Uncharacterized protein n=1 Tax=Colletotrichum phormii TaxID=359342 RepID=A0AAJ0A113_9PEZI|nr:uncharacterized protein BDP81DRAFT_83143 [Colletotrichum phormii]KAK1654426.1 hypothetical protein BDP81DRAFT_83143 [Colletotrichum phormii]
MSHSMVGCGMSVISTLLFGVGGTFRLATTLTGRGHRRVISCASSDCWAWCLSAHNLRRCRGGVNTYSLCQAVPSPLFIILHVVDERSLLEGTRELSNSTSFTSHFGMCRILIC